MTTSMFRPYAEYDADSDAIYVYLLNAPVTRTKSIDDICNIDYSGDGGVVGLEFLGVSAGVDLADVPCAQTVERLIGELGLDIKLFA